MPLPHAPCCRHLADACVPCRAQAVPAQWASALAFDDLIAPRSQVGSGYVITGNTLANNRGRGMILKGSNGLVADNTIAVNRFTGILVSNPLRCSPLLQERQCGPRPTRGMRGKLHLTWETKMEPADAMD